MTAENIEKAIKSVELCSAGYSEKECEKCPYYKSGDKHWTCMDDRYTDLVKILKWSLSVYKTIDNFIHAKG